VSTTIASRIASLLVVALYVGLAAFDVLPHSVRGTLGCAILFGLPLIWLPEPIGSLSGYLGHGRVTIETPPFLVAFAGWVFLLVVPLVVAVLSQPGQENQRHILGE